MKKYLRLFGCNGKFADETEYIKTDNDSLIVEITTNFGHNTTLFAKINNGVEEKSIKIINKQFEIRNDFLNVGECFLKVVAMVGSKVVGQYTCPSILVKEIDNDKIIIDKLQDFEFQIKEMKSDLEKEKDFLRNEIIKMQKTIKELIIAE